MNFGQRAYSPNLVEEEFSEVHGSKLPWSGWPLGLWGGAMRPSPTLYLQGSPPMWQGIVASRCDLLRPNLPENFSKRSTYRTLWPRRPLRGDGGRSSATVLEIFLLLEFLHSLLATCSLLLGCQTPPSRICGFARSLIN